MFGKIRCFTRVSVLVFCLMFCSVSALYAEEELQFPETAEEISKALKVDLPDKLKGRGGLESKDDGTDLFGKKKSGVNTRGLAKIVADERALESAPKIGALILFDYDSADIRAESLPLLREYGKALQTELQGMVLVVAGHTDSDGTEEYNLSLSERRAKSVKEFFVSEFQIEEESLLVKPYGEQKPIRDNESAEGRATNRRVEFIRIR